MQGAGACAGCRWGRSPSTAARTAHFVDFLDTVQLAEDKFLSDNQASPQFAKQ